MSSFPLRPRRLSAFLLPLVALVVAACGDSSTAPAPAPVPVASVQVSGETTPLTTGVERQLHAIPRDASGAALTGRAVTWSSSNPSVASVSVTGRVVALSPGATVVTATVGGRDGTMALVVQPMPLAQLTLSETAFVLTRQSARQLAATARDAADRPMPGVVVAWSSEDESVAIVTGSGRVLAVGSGTTRITASAGGRSASAVVTVPATVASVAVTPGAAVLSEGTSRQYEVRVLDDRGRPMPAASVTWTTGNPAIAQVSASGQVLAIGRGYTTITATVAGVSGSVAVTVVHSEWRFGANLGTPFITLDTVTVREDAEAAIRVTREAQLVSASFSWNTHAGTWSLEGQVRIVEYSEVLGNVIMQVREVRELRDAGTVSGYDWLSGDPYLRSSFTQGQAFRLSPHWTQATLTGTVRGYPLTVSIPLAR